MSVLRFEEVWAPFSSEAFTDFLGLGGGEQGQSLGTSAGGCRGSPFLAVFTPVQNEEKETYQSLGTKTRGMGSCGLSLWIIDTSPKPKL